MLENVVVKSVECEELATVSSGQHLAPELN